MIGRVLFVVVAVLGFALDRATKLIVNAQLGLGEHHGLIAHVLEFRYVRNSGIAFGLLANRGSLVLGGSIVVGILLFVFLLRVHPGDYLTITGGALVTAGALGNLYDRIDYRYVIDFIHISHWPTFNVADICITFGVVLIVLGQLRDIISPRIDGESSSTRSEQTP